MASEAIRHYARNEHLFHISSIHISFRAERRAESGHRCHTFFLDAEITNLLKAWSAGDPAALDQLSLQVYDELRRMARRHMKGERRDNTLQTTALVHEVYLRMVDVTKVEWQHRAQFFAIAAQMMRRILVDAARERASHKRGRGAVHVNFDETAIVSPARPTTGLASIEGSGSLLVLFQGKWADISPPNRIGRNPSR